MLRFIFSLFSLATVTLAVTCYGPLGDPVELHLCDPSAQVSTCCNGADYCLSNGLCFQAGGNNLLANQGCSDPNWAAPCHRYCSKPGFGQSLFPCSSTENPQDGAISYCCGPNGSCCDTPGNIFPVPVGRIILRPDQLSPSSTVTVQTVTVTQNPAATTLHTLTSITTQSATAIQPANKPRFDALALGLGVSLGVGIGLISQWRSVVSFIWVKKTHPTG